jgi:protein SCO1/2
MSVLKKILILALILVLPGFLYYSLTVKGKNRYHSLSIFGPKVVAKTVKMVKGKAVPDTIYHTLPQFTLTSQDGKAVSSNTFADKIIVTDFFYTRSTGICAEVHKNIDSLAIEYKNNKLVSFASITVDPVHDVPAVLKAYAQKYNPPANWLFLTGDTSTIYPLARNGFLVNAVDEGNGNFIYADKVILIDKSRRIRGYYDGTSPDDMTRLDSELKVLIDEQLLNENTPVY